MGRKNKLDGGSSSLFFRGTMPSVVGNTLKKGMRLEADATTTTLYREVAINQILGGQKVKK